MSGANCRWCGAYLDALEDHDEDACYAERQRDTYARGAEKARAARADARAGNDTEGEQ